MSFSPAPSLAPDDTRSKLLYVKQWPDFSTERDLSRIGDLARICALLSRKPTVGFLVHRSLDMPSHEAEPLLLHLIEVGSVAVFQTGTEPLAAAPGESGLTPTSATTPTDASAPAAGTENAAAAPARSFLKRLWNKLLTP